MKTLFFVCFLQWVFSFTYTLYEKLGGVEASSDVHLPVPTAEEERSRSRWFLFTLFFGWGIIPFFLLRGLLRIVREAELPELAREQHLIAPVVHDKQGGLDLCQAEEGKEKDES